MAEDLKPTVIEGYSDVPRKPLLFADNPFFDERLDDLEFSGTNWDASYVPIYSDLKRENDIRISQGKKPLPMPRLYWGRVNKPDGSQIQGSDEGMLQLFQLGYKACGIEDLENAGFKMPPTAHVGADGLIRRGVDLALFIVDAERADRNRARQRALNEEYKGHVPDSKTGEVRPVEEDRLNQSGTLQELMHLDLPNY